MKVGDVVWTKVKHNRVPMVVTWVPNSEYSSTKVICGYWAVHRELGMVFREIEIRPDALEPAENG